MNLTAQVMQELRKRLKINARNQEYQKIEEAITVLNVAYLKLAADEIHGMIGRGVRIRSKYGLLMSIYNKHIREHQVMFLLFSIFENAMRSKAAVTISQHYSVTGTDDWWKDASTMNRNLIQPVSGALYKLHRNILTINTYDIFDTFTFGQLQHIYKNCWSQLQSHFLPKPYKSYTLPHINNSDMHRMFEYIRQARNDISHHKPIDYSRRARRDLIEDCEVLLCHLDFNLVAAVNKIDPTHSIIRLRYI